MARGKRLPDGLDEPGRQFVTELRRLKDSSGLSLAALAGRTSYSKSSWERYLNGSHLPPAVAVQELARLGGGDVGRTLALRSLAEESRSAVGEVNGVGTSDARSHAEDSAGAASGGVASADVAVPPRRPSRGAVVALAAAMTTGLLATAAVLLLASPETRGSENTGERRATASAFVFQPGRTYTCDIHREGGLLHAGYSDTGDALLQQISTSWEVVEAQCLLEYRGYSPGDIDGAYGAQTEKAVKRLQDASGLVTDGIMGPHTWEALRR